MYQFRRGGLTKRSNRDHQLAKPTTGPPWGSSRTRWSSRIAALLPRLLPQHIYTIFCFDTITTNFKRETRMYTYTYNSWRWRIDIANQVICYIAIDHKTKKKQELTRFRVWREDLQENPAGSRRWPNVIARHWRSIAATEVGDATSLVRTTKGKWWRKEN